MARAIKLSNGHVTDHVSTVGYPSDSLASSCCELRTYMRIVHQRVTSLSSFIFDVNDYANFTYNTAIGCQNVNTAEVNKYGDVVVFVDSCILSANNLVLAFAVLPVCIFKRNGIFARNHW